MADRGVALTVAFMVWDTAANTPLLGDAGNLTMRVILDDAAAAGAANAPAEREHGLYVIDLTAAEMDALFVTLEGTSATPNSLVVPVKMSTQASAEDIIDAGLAHDIDPEDEVADTIAWWLRLLVQAAAGETESDVDANTLKIFDPEGGVMVTLTHAKLGSVITRTPS